MAHDDKTADMAAEILAGGGRRSGLRRILPFLGPAFVASVAYVDPGNFATNIQGGAKFGYLLLWVVLASNLMAMLIQALSAKLGIATGMNLAELCRAHFPRSVAISMWVLMELAAMATDLAEFLGAALAFNILFGIALLPAGLLTAAATFLILGLERFGFRLLERVITAMVAVVAICYLIEMVFSRPRWDQVLYHMVVPEFQGGESVLLAAGILGATVMPHAIFLHSALTQGRIVPESPTQMKLLYRFELADVIVAMSLASAVNVAMLVMAASTFFDHGLSGIGAIEEAHRTLQPLLGRAAAMVFGVSLLASGLSSSSVGTMAGQVIMQGFVRRKIPVWFRRLVTFVPALVVIAAGADPTRSMVISQVVLSLALPFAVAPLVLFTSSRKIMGDMVNRIWTVVLGTGCGVLIIVLNVYLLYQTLFKG